MFELPILIAVMTGRRCEPGRRRQSARRSTQVLSRPRDSIRVITVIDITNFRMSDADVVARSAVVRQIDVPVAVADL